MRRVLVCCAGALALFGLALVPSKASAGWGWWGPSLSITVGPRYGYYRPYGYYGYPYGYGPYAYYGYRPYGYYGYRYAYRWRRW
jgi:hypothetical protein